MLHTQELTASVLMWVLQFSTSWAADMAQGGLMSHGTSLNAQSSAVTLTTRCQDGVSWWTLENRLSHFLYLWPEIILKPCHGGCLTVQLASSDSVGTQGTET